MLAVEVLEIPIQINGKVRSKILVPSDISASDLKEAALNDPKISSEVSGKDIRKEIVINGKLVNFVT